MLFCLAVLLIIISLNLVVYFAFSWLAVEPIPLALWLKQPYWLFVTGGIVLVIAITSFVRSWQLKSTPDAVAKMVNATPISVHSKDPKEQQLINVVEEMSIASGTPMPKVFVMREEPAMNAFVAGLSTENIVLVVTQGLLENLSRQELQGVIAHEYSHVFHGDMQINVKLIGILAGILVIGQLGYFILRVGSSGRSSNSKGNALPVFAIGAGLFIIGYIGLFFGRLIKAAISRQREFLADASAVQYTRDRQGICGALHKIANNASGTLLANKKAEEMSHMCFGQAVKLSFKGLLATHPPIDERIKAIDPQFKYVPSAVERVDTHEESADAFSKTSAFSAFVSQQIGQPNNPKDKKSDVKIPKTHIMKSVGAISPKHLDVTHQLFNKTPNKLLNIARGNHESISNRDLIFALLLLEQESHSNAKLAKLFKDKDNFEAIQSLSQQLSSLSYSQHYLLLEVALSRFDELLDSEKQVFILELNTAIQHDGEVTLTEFMIYASCARRSLNLTKPNKQFSRFNLIANDIALFVSLLFRQSNFDEKTQVESFKKQMKIMGMPQAQFTVSDFQAQPIANALNRISNLHPLLKKDFLELCVDIVEQDGKINQKKYELIRLLGEYLGCPFPIFDAKLVA
ncbi:M48 family metalloprotease [Aliikangiella marina]|uniref:M48 family metalloprotease n=1 Tax=Aliikangiella marina TaxID=1712262 RepID=A0A545TCF4_9GAMM|nr:M48 family metallopeptidase [Aliikangiella marina]TQV74898.1 M48 family metalloprotease [Aliikangiella marina]